MASAPERRRCSRASRFGSRFYSAKRFRKLYELLLFGPKLVRIQIAYHGQPLGLIVASDHETARAAANAVIVRTTAKRAIVTIEVLRHL